MKHKDADFVERRDAAKDAKAALLEKMKARQNDPAAEARRAERAAIAAAREEREQAKRDEAERQRQDRAEKKALSDAEDQAILEAARAEEDAAKKVQADDLVAQLLRDEAARKVARDARYAARQSRKG